MKLSVCIEMFWEDLPFEDRIQKVAEKGIPAIEFWGWKNKNLEKVHAQAEEFGLKVASFASALDEPLVSYQSEKVLVDSMKKAAQAARTLECSTVILTSGQIVPGASRQETQAHVVKGLKALDRVLEDENLTLVLEPLNPIVDHVGCWLTRTDEAVEIVNAVGSPRVKILYDIYHQQITEGNVISTIAAHKDLIGHYHAAGVPGRHELGGGELDYANIFAGIKASGYEGYMGLELSPTQGEDAALTEAIKLFNS